VNFCLELYYIEYQINDHVILISKCLPRVNELTKMSEKLRLLQNDPKNLYILLKVHFVIYILKSAQNSLFCTYYDLFNEKNSPLERPF
jgi:hypothetical protein